jgi:hypothetical protein
MIIYDEYGYIGDWRVYLINLLNCEDALTDDFFKAGQSYP